MTDENRARSRLSGPALAGPALRRAVREVVGRHLDPQAYRFFLFGSEAEGTARPGSDVDVGILGPEPVPPRIMQAIRAELERLRTLRPFDVVDFRRVDERFRAVTLRKVEPLDREIL
jgi:predicted nucleotidyltransferase